MRPSGRTPEQIRRVRFERHYTKYAEGSVLACYGETQVLCTASVEERTPPFLRGTNKGWLTAEYGMLPRATAQRTTRESSQGRPSGRSAEIQRLIGRSLRAALDLKAFGERQIVIDCDVLQADGGTRTAAISGGFVALYDAIEVLRRRGLTSRDPLHGAVAAVSVGIFRGQPVLDLDYAEDREAETDLNVVMNDNQGFIELQGTAEGHAFRREELDRMLALALVGMEQIFAAQRQALAMS